MKKKSKLDFYKTKNNFSEFKSRLLFVIGALIIFRIGSIIPIPGINVSILMKLFEQKKGTIIEIFNMFSGGALSRASIFALGIMPYISASIIMQLLSVINSELSEIKKEGEFGRQRINQYTRYVSLFLAIVQSIGISISLSNMQGIDGLIVNSGFLFYFISVISLVTGTIFLMWIGEQITEKGIGNGISIIIFAGIVSGLPNVIGNVIENARQENLHFLYFLLVLFLMFIVIYFIVFVERGQRRIIVSYAKRQQGRRIYAAQNTHLPLKINMSGVMPAIFSSSVILFPGTLASWFGNETKLKFLSTISFYLQPGKMFYIFLYAILIVFFCFFYTALVFSPRETAENLKKSGAFIPGIRPGVKTARYIDKIMVRLTLVGSIYITLICLMPEFARHFIKVPFHFGGTSLLIMIVVIMDFMSQVQTLLISKQYESMLRRANLKDK